MAVGPVGSVIYTNQNMNVAASKQNDHQNRIELQNVINSPLSEEKKEVKAIRPTEETYKIDPENEHEKDKHKQEENNQDEEIESQKDEEELEEKDIVPITKLDIIV